jgi:3-phenylpropionate/cinnamic acid dioxygenase small subunit
MDNDDKRNELNTRIYKVYTGLGDVSNDHEYNRKLSGFARIYVGGEETVIKRVNGEEVMIENCVMFTSLFAEDFCKGDRAEAARVFHSVDEVIGWTL